MDTCRLTLLGLPALLLATAALPGADRALARERGAPADDARALAARIDERLAAGWARAQVAPAPPADDAEFLRRVALDLTGRIPSVAETRAFLADRASDKRERLVARLLDSPRYVEHFKNVWRALLLPEANTGIQTRVLVPGFEAWLRKRLADNTSYDRMVREILTTPLGPGRGRGFYAGPQGDPTPAAFYVAKDSKPENLAASTARLFLGVRLECAQCHNHPFASWKREQFWSLAAFFAGMERPPRDGAVFAAAEASDRHELTIPGTDRVVQAGFLDGTKPAWKSEGSPRATLAEWLTARNNPYFARAAVNRLWAHFFGTGLVEPVDDLGGGETSASHPELLDELAAAFVAHDFDLKFLMRSITASRAYQLSSRMTDKSQDDPRLFARMAVRGLSPEQLYDSLAQATGFQEPATPDRRFKFLGNTPRTEFLNKFSQVGESSTDAATSIVQALALMNGKLTADATSLEQSETLAAVADAPFLDTTGRVEALYLAALSRPPSPKELARAIKYIEAEGADTEPRSRERGLADVFWVLLNSAEFMLNH
jgi:hypothetical protein